MVRSDNATEPCTSLYKRGPQGARAPLQSPYVWNLAAPAARPAALEHAARGAGVRGEHALELVGEGGGLRRRLGFSGPCVGSWMEDANILWEGQKSSKRIAGLGRTTALHYCSSTSHAPFARRIGA